MQLLAPDTGWFLAGNKLLWTEDNGQHWVDITPPMSLPHVSAASKEKIANVFFKDVNDGWVLLSTGENDHGGEARFEVASTVDSGASWSVSPVEIPGLDWRQTILYGAGRVFFLDSRHGWLNLDVESSPNFRLAILLATEDGGRTWMRRPSGTGGVVSFATLDAGWVAGGPGGAHLYATTDGGKTWQEVELKAPPEIGPALGGLYGVAPIFTDANHGYLPASYPSARALVLFATDDSGATWRPHRVFKGLPFIGAIPYPSAVTDSAWLTAFLNQSTLNVMKTGIRGGGTRTVETARAMIQRQPLPRGSRLPILEMTFSTAEQGWIRTDSMLATEDGGATWSEIPPLGPAPKMISAVRVRETNPATDHRADQ
ncbi:MAG TPA: hypothetical protein VG204_14430 [Terriglobia bacterium]|nr:hypothetical protein [Terriglobia bacterium]